MKQLFFVFFTLLAPTVLAQSIDTITVNFEGTSMYYITATGNTQLLTFLHGGVNNPIFSQPETPHTLEELLEDNDAFIPMALENGFDLLIPITNKQMNWLTEYDYCHELITSFIATKKSYHKNYISGFSDGGTGSYKIFYSHPESYDGLIVFNGYPQHHNFYQSIDYNTVSNKPVLYFSTFKDKQIPYEFLLTEYAKQKEFNPNTYFRVSEGKHTFNAYSSDFLLTAFNLLKSKSKCSGTTPVHAFILEDEIQEFYPFRKKIVRQFHYDHTYYEFNKAQLKTYKNGN